MKRAGYFIAIIIAIGHFANAQNDADRTNTLQNDFSNFAKTENSLSFTAGLVPTFTAKEETVGSRYLFTKWVNGSVVNLHDSVFAKPSLLFNYDKVSKKLLLTENKSTAIEIFLDQIKSFSLKDDNKEYNFERVAIINNNDFFQPLVKNESKYSLYRLLQTKFIKANYSTNGISESGNKFDEYKDEVTYYIVLPGAREFKKAELKKKSIKQALSADAAKINDYFSAHEQDAVNEDFLVSLIKSLNQ